MYFTGKSENYCVCYITLINLDNNNDLKSSSLQYHNGYESEKLRKYYLLFIDTIACLTPNFNAKIIKQIGDSLILYFPKTSDYSDKSAFRDVLECALTMSAARSVINTKADQECIPPVNYRISMDYGKVTVARNTSYYQEEASGVKEDLFGTTMNLCSKINVIAPPNSIVIGGDLYRMIKSLKLGSTRNEQDNCDVIDDDDSYLFYEVGEYSLGFKQRYPVYSVVSGLTERGLHDGGNRRRTLLAESYLKEEYGVKEKSTQYQFHQQQQIAGAHKKKQQKQLHNILVVDDEPDTIFTYKIALIADGYCVDAFTDSREALKYFVQKPALHYSLVILDIRMPGLNGLQLYFRLKAMDPQIKVLFVTALDAAEELISMLPNAMFDDIIKKPTNPQYLVGKVRTMINTNTSGIEQLNEKDR
jgi:two-component system, OmpR family, response regulator ChvI